VPKFSPCAASRLVAQSQIDSLIANGLEVISCGVPFADKEIFWANHGRCRPQSKRSLTLYLIVVWRVYLLTSWRKSTNDRRSHFHDTSEIIKKAILKHML
jgi:hypothetical protein